MKHQRRKPRWGGIAITFGIVGWLLVGCGGSPDSVRMIPESRELDAPVFEADGTMSDAERFGFVPHDHDHGHHHHHDHDVPVAEESAAPAPVPQESPLAWTAPTGWVEGPDRPMREVTFTLDDDGATECYVAILRGDGGGLGANINRWLAQFGHEALSEEAVAALPRFPMLEAEAVLIETEGDYVGMTGEVMPDAALLGAVCLLPEFSVFVKMTGPAETLNDEREAFMAFCESLRLR